MSACGSDSFELKKSASEGIMSQQPAAWHNEDQSLPDDEQLDPLLEHDRLDIEQWRDGGQLEDDDEYHHVRNLLYTSHFLSTWNSRLFEFGAFLFLSHAYPNTLLPASVYALARAASAAVLSPVLGGYIDSVNRLSIVRLSIGKYSHPTSGQFESLRATKLHSIAVLAALSLLACVEKLAAILNLISVERDWVIVVAGGNETRLGVLNSQMRRIDLFCKFIGPLTIAFIDGASPRIAIISTGSMTVLSVMVEYFSIARVYNTVPALQAPKTVPSGPAARQTVWTRLRSSISGTALYVRHRAFLPSLALSFLYLTVLSFGGQLLTWLLNLGVSSGMIGALRGISAVFELSATWLASIVMKRIGPVRSGIWFLNWEIFCVAIACGFFWVDNVSPTIAAIGTVTAVIASRVGLWGFDLSAQLIIQEEVEPDLRGTFSSQESSLQNVFEMLAFASTVVFPRPEDFKYPATISAGAVMVAGILYAAFLRSRRGHLLHFSNCVDRNGNDKGHTHWWKIKVPVPMRGPYENIGDQESEAPLLNAEDGISGTNNDLATRQLYETGK